MGSMPEKSREIVGLAAPEFCARLQQGTTLYGEGAYREALAAFESILQEAPGNIETRVWIRKTREALDGIK